ncbi:Polynucleotide kinase 3 phosphatase [Trypanosoma melophagium]|uniref:Polynucleotide kinase 3 phosphatase n=1 Tax=Trypanosoma melophagium TaxID=715481 RepID=UPI00351A2987|nr:Polynucleotide kinase 3 phosphatase [Trypanosoma melophagium]
MSDAHRVLLSERDSTLGKLCSERKVSPADVWLPLALLRPARGKEDTPVYFSPTTPLALLEHNTGKLITHRNDILSKIPLLFADEVNLAIPSSAVPMGFTLFAHVSKNMSKKRIAKGVSVLYRPITVAQAVAEGSARVEKDTKDVRKHSRVSVESGVDTSTIAGDEYITLEKRRKKREKSDALFEEYLQKSLESSSSSDYVGQGNAILKGTLTNLIRVRDAVPLHFFTHGKSQISINVKGLVWNIPDNRVLYRIFRREGSSGSSGKSTYSDVARLIAVFMIDGVLLKREPLQNYLQDKHFEWSLIDMDLPSIVHKLAEKGYRIVVLDHYPSLHHGNTLALEAKLQPITELCQKHFNCDVTVLLSTMSYVSASYRRDGMPFVLPYSGIWQFFITQLNSGLRADADSLLVGASSDETPDNANLFSQSQRDCKFAMNCGLRFMDAMTLKREILQS